MKTLARQTDKAEILHRLKAVRPDSVRRWGRMSAHQMVCHLSDSFRMACGQKAGGQASGRLQRTIVKWVALCLPLRWPTGILTTTPELDQEVDGTRPADFAADIAELEALVKLFLARERNLEGQSHPIFGRMTHAAWLRWAYLHMDHHLRQFGA